MREPGVASVMTRPVITTSPDTPFKDVVSRSAVDVAALLTKAVPGVIGVRNQLHYIIDDTATAGI